MKTKMKFFAALVIMMGFTMSAMAQNTVTDNVIANATVQTQLIVSQQQPLEFGTVINVANMTKTVSTLGVATSTGNAVGQQGVQSGIGKIVRTGNAIITYKLTHDANLTSTTSKLPLTGVNTAYTVTAVEGTLTGTQTTGAAITADTQVAGTGNFIYVHIGATVTPDATTTLNGIHTGNITLSAEYN